MALLDDNSLIDLKKVKVPNGRKMIEPITQDELETFDNYLPEELEKNIYRNKQSNVSDEVNGIKLYQILGNKFNKKTYEPSIKQNTGFNLTTLNSISGEIKDIECIKPTVLLLKKVIGK